MYLYDKINYKIKIKMMSSVLMLMYLWDCLNFAYSSFDEATVIWLVFF